MSLEFISNTTFIVFCWKAIHTYWSVTGHLFSHWVKQKVNTIFKFFTFFFLNFLFFFLPRFIFSALDYPLNKYKGTRQYIHNSINTGVEDLNTGVEDLKGFP